MIKFNTTAAQGDVYFRKVQKLPDGLKKVTPAGNHIVVTHSETGQDRKSTRLNSSHVRTSRMPSSA